MLDGGVEKAHKAVRANELATSERTTEKEIFPDGKKVLDAGLRACLETHLSIMKRFNSMLAMAI